MTTELDINAIAHCPRCGALASERDIVNGEVVWVRYECGYYTGATFAGRLACDLSQLRAAFKDLGHAFLTASRREEQ